MTSLAHNTSNSAALEEQRKAFFSDVRELGRESAQGKDSLPRLALRVADAVTRGCATPDDMKQVYDEYVTAESKKLIHSDGGKAANASKLKQIATAAALTSVQFSDDVLERACQLHADMRKENLKPKSAYAAYVDVARAQIASPKSPLTDDELRDLMSVEPKAKDAKSLLKSAAKSLEKALALPDMNDVERELADIALARTTEALAKLEQRETREAKLAELDRLRAELAAA